MTVSSEDLVNILLRDGPTNMRNFVCTRKRWLLMLNITLLIFEDNKVRPRGNDLPCVTFFRIIVQTNLKNAVL